MTDPNLIRPFEASYTSHVAYARALEEYCNTLEQLIDANNLWSYPPTQGTQDENKRSV